MRLRMLGVLGVLGAAALAGCATGGADVPWSEKVKLSGSLRYRLESIDRETDLDKNVENRVQAKIGIKVEANEEVDLGFALVSGSNGTGSGTSTNQTLDGEFGTKDINLDLAYFDYHPEAVEGLRIIGGKMKLPYHKPGKSELLWDSDVRPEGLAVKYKTKVGPLDLTATAGGFWVEETHSATDSADAGLFGGQLVLKHKLDDNGMFIQGGVSYYNYGNLQLLAAPPPFDYDNVEIFLEFGFKAADIPILLFVDSTQNNGAPEPVDDGAILFGVKAGKVKDAGSFAARLIYRDIDAGAVLATFTDSDFVGGAGGPAEGIEVGLDYQVLDNTTASVTYFSNTIDPDGADTDYSRVQIDLKFKF